MVGRKNLFWVIYFAFVAIALFSSGHGEMLAWTGPAPLGKFAVWAAFLAFTGFSYYCSTRENLFKTIGKMNEMHWGRQIGLDLYIGVSLSLCIIYLHQGSLLVLLLWLLPMLAFANLATLLYLAIHYDSLVLRLLG